MPPFLLLIAVLALLLSSWTDEGQPLGLAVARGRMIEDQVKRMAGGSEEVLAAFRKVPRHAFIPRDLWALAHADRAVRRPDGETVTAPDLSAAMLASLDLTKESRVLECGTRSGWFTALLAVTAGEVHTVDARPAFSASAAKLLGELGISNIRFHVGDPLDGWWEAEPYDAIVINGLVDHIPRDLYRARVPGGRILAPVGRVGEAQSLILSVKGDPAPRKTRPIVTVRFKPLAR